MIVLHAIWDNAGNVAQGRLRVWAESSTLPLTTTKRTGKQDIPRPHPFVLAQDSLREALGDIVSSLLIGKVSSQPFTLRLPSTSKGPLPSPELILEDPVESKSAEFKWWDVDTLPLAPGTALDFLLALPATPPHGVAYGSSLRFWTECAQLALELLSRQSFVPTLHDMQHGRAYTCYAAWDALVSPEDNERLDILVKAMPPVCWSFVPPGDAKASLLRDLVLTFLNQGIDAFVRENIELSTMVPDTYRRSRAKVKPLPEQWLSALTTENTELKASAEELKAFVSTMRGWLDQVKPVESGAPFRTCFRLDPPAEKGEEEGKENEDEQPWSVSFLLQANDDRSLLVPAEKVWKERSGTLTFLKRKFENPQERLLADLAKASRLFPTIEESLQTARPTGVTLSIEQAYKFLRESAPLLEQSGFGVLVPPWWQKRSARVGVRLKVKPATADSKASSGLMGLDSLVSYDWNVAVGDTVLTPNEFERLVKLKQPLVHLRGQWVELRPEEIEAAIAFFKKKHARKNMSLGEALRISLGAQTPEVGLPITELEAEGWIKDVMDNLSQDVKLSSIKVPETFHGTLRPYQLKGTSWLAFLKQFGFGACLADSMGLGKCLAAGSSISINGTLQKIEDVWGRYVEETTFDGEGYWAVPTEELYINSIDEVRGHMVQAPIKHLYRQYISTHLRKIHLEDGNSVTITYPHKLLTDKGWTNDLHVGDYVCVPAKMLWEGKPEDPDLVKFLAWQIAEGYELKSPARVIVTQKDTVLLEEMRDCLHRFCKKHDINIHNPSIHTFKDRCPNLVVSSKEYKSFLKAKGYIWGNLSSEKRIPDFIMQADLDTIRIFLRNFFEAEASVVASMSSIEISTASPMLIQQLSYLLRRFGIWMRLSVKQKRATNGSGIYRPYQTGVLGGIAVRKFCEQIGFVGSKKQGKLVKLCEIVCNTNVEGIPASSIMAETVSITKLPPAHFGMSSVYLNGSQQFSQISLRRVASAFDDILSGEAERIYREKPLSRWTKNTLRAYVELDKFALLATRVKLQQLLDQEVFYCRIKKIEEIQYDGWVYDCEIEKYHNFVANNIICHNTIQLIALLLHEREIVQQNGNLPLQPTLLICPMSIVGNWHKEIERFAPSLSAMVHHGAERLSGEEFQAEAKRHDVVITTYSLALRDKEHLGALQWENIVLDEAQNIKNETAKQTQAIRRFNANHKIALTGTPVENRLSELWSIMEFLNPGYLGSGDDFRKTFSIPIERYRNADRLEMLRKLIQPFVLRRLKTDKSIISDLPDKVEMKVFCNLTQEQASLYEAVVKEMVEKIEEAEAEGDTMARRGLILAALMKLKQVCNHPAHFMSDGSSLPRRSGKLERLEEMLEEALAEGDKALIFTQFAEMGTLLRQYLQERLDCEVLFLHGGTPKKQRDMMVQRFQEERRGAPIFILSLKAGGVGLNLTAANHVFHFDRWWNPAVENQATDRAFRIGQRKDVQVHKFVCVGTLEERIDQMIEQKKELAENIVGAGEGWLTEMSTSQLKELFQLGQEAVTV